MSEYLKKKRRAELEEQANKLLGQKPIEKKQCFQKGCASKKSMRDWKKRTRVELEENGLSNRKPKKGKK